LKVILLTHCHQDHCANLSEWLSDTTVTVIAQREINSCNEYRARLTPFFARRGAIWSRQQLPDSAKIHKEQSVVPTITYLDEYNFELGGLHFYLTHTPGETPDHTTIWIPELQAVFVGDNYYEYFINNATLRGTSLRPVLGYIQALDLALSYKPEYFLRDMEHRLLHKRLSEKPWKIYATDCGTFTIKPSMELMPERMFIP
jgi:glyoxylase-like metal-dependent hydrolase (beta-lactamase superfamily II)